MSSSNTRFYRLVLIALVLSVLMTILSAYIRLSDSGYGCNPWPGCYSTNIIVDTSPGVTITGDDSNIALRALHRLLATVFGLLALVIIMAAFWYHKELGLNPGWSVLVVLITVVLSYVGMNTPNVQFPGITMVNLSGGMLLSMTLLHMLLRLRRAPTERFSLTAACSIFVVCMGFVVIMSGAWVSGNFAAAACDSFLSCGPSTGAVSESFAPARKLLIVDGQLDAGAIDARITWVHHALTALFAGLVFIYAAISLVRLGPAFHNVAPPALVITAISIGLLEMNNPSLLLATLHNAVALALLLSLVLQANKVTQP